LFVSGPSALEYVFGAKTIEQASRPYAGLARQGVRVVKAEAQAIDPVRKTVTTTAGAFAYTTLVLASGIRLAPEEIEGLGGAEANLTPWDRAHLPELRRRIESLSGGTAVIGVPVGALKCPPGPYEYALLLARHFARRGRQGRVVLIDSWPIPQSVSVAPGFQAAIESFGERIEYVPQARVARVDAAARKVLTADGDEFDYELLSLIPPNRAWGLVKDLGLAAAGDAFVDVEPLTQRSRRFETLYAVGDVARAPFGKSASAAANAGLLAARAIVRTLGSREGADGAARIQVACYPFVEGFERSLAIETDFALTPRAGADAVLDMKLSADPQPSEGSAAKRRAWESATLKAAFAA
ncbi:MAG: FAD/NAD(P)-binding oxidoreductase, partial [Pseudomonadota bacterium]